MGGWVGAPGCIAGPATQPWPPYFFGCAFCFAAFYHAPCPPLPACCRRCPAVQPTGLRATATRCVPAERLVLLARCVRSHARLRALKGSLVMPSP